VIFCVLRLPSLWQLPHRLPLLPCFVSPLHTKSLAAFSPPLALFSLPFSLPPLFSLSCSLLRFLASLSLFSLPLFPSPSSPSPRPVAAALCVLGLAAVTLGGSSPRQPLLLVAVVRCAVARWGWLLACWSRLAVLLAFAPNRSQRHAVRSSLPAERAVESSAQTRWPLLSRHGLRHRHRRPAIAHTARDPWPNFARSRAEPFTRRSRLLDCAPPPGPRAVAPPRPRPAPPLGPPAPRPAPHPLPPPSALALPAPPPLLPPPCPPRAGGCACLVSYNSGILCSLIPSGLQTDYAAYSW